MRERDLSETAMIHVQPNRGALSIASANTVAEACRDIVKATAVKVGGGTHIGIEGWLAIAGQHGCTISSRRVKKVEGGYTAEGVVKNSEGHVLSTAEGFVGDDERMWARRDEYAKRGMAQTRAMSRAARNVFAHVVVAMKAGIRTTPAEEMPVEPEEDSMALFVQIGKWLREKPRDNTELNSCRAKVGEHLESGRLRKEDAEQLLNTITAIEATNDTTGG